MTTESEGDVPGGGKGVGGREGEEGGVGRGRVKHIYVYTGCRSSEFPVVHLASEFQNPLKGKYLLFPNDSIWRLPSSHFCFGL